MCVRVVVSCVPVVVMRNASGFNVELALVGRRATAPRLQVPVASNPCRSSVLLDTLLVSQPISPELCELVS